MLMIRAKLEGDKLSLPTSFMKRAGLIDGDEVEVRLVQSSI